LPDGTEEYVNQFDGSLKGIKLGIPWRFLEGLAPEVKNNFMQAIEVCKKLGATVVDIDLDILRYSLAVYYILATAEASTNLARFDGIRYGVRSPDAKTLEEVYDMSRHDGFGAEVKRRILLGTYVLSAGYQDDYYKKAQKVRTLMIRKFREAFRQCDLIAMPPTPSAAFELGSKVKDPLEMYLEDIYTIGVNLAGLPAICVPSGFTADGKPLGLQLIGPVKHDMQVCRAADAYEKATLFTQKQPPL
jgi:aspartyl-tRNA(Asn)/glutamyl-tRNA(Gln) amidotransferase subunit A